MSKYKLEYLRDAKVRAVFTRFANHKASEQDVVRTLDLIVGDCCGEGKPQEENKVVAPPLKKKGKAILKSKKK